MAQLRGFVKAVSIRDVKYMDKKTKKEKTFQNRSFNVEGIWLQVNDNSISLPEKVADVGGQREVSVIFHRVENSKVDEKSGEKKYFQNLICDGWKYVD